MFLDDIKLGNYAKLVYLYGIQIGCNFNSEFLEKYPLVLNEFNYITSISHANRELFYSFDELYIM